MPKIMIRGADGLLYDQNGSQLFEAQQQANTKSINKDIDSSLVRTRIQPTAAIVVRYPAPVGILSQYPQNIRDGLLNDQKKQHK